MAQLTLRVRTSPGQVTTEPNPMTNFQLDDNFINLNDDIQSRVLKSGDTLAGKLNFASSTNSFSSVNIPNGQMPETPVSGDIWFNDDSLHIESSGALLISKGSTAARPNNAAVGMIRYNTSTNTFEGYSGATPNWQAIGANTQVVREDFVAVLNQTSFSVSSGLSQTDVIHVYLNGVILVPNIDYTINNSTDIVISPPTDDGDILTVIVIKAASIGFSVADNSLSATVASDNASASNKFIGFYDTASGQSQFKSSSNLTYNPSTNTVVATNFSNTSDINLKENIKKITSGIDVICKLNGYEFNYKDTGLKASGVIAQEIEEVLPHIVNEASGNKNVSYTQIIAYMIESIKEQQTQINALIARINTLENK